MPLTGRRRSNRCSWSRRDAGRTALHHRRRAIPAAISRGPKHLFLRHVAPAEHPTFYAAARATLNVTRQSMAEIGWCPSGRLFEAAACGTPIFSDWWEGLDEFFRADREILIVRTTDDVLAALDRERCASLAQIGAAARERALSEHTAERRAADWRR